MSANDANRANLDARVLATLPYAPSCIHAGTVAVYVNVTVSAASASLARLIAAGLVVKMPKPIIVRNNAAGPVYRDAAGFARKIEDR